MWACDKYLGIKPLMFNLTYTVDLLVCWNGVLCLTQMYRQPFITRCWMSLKVYPVKCFTVQLVIACLATPLLMSKFEKGFLTSGNFTLCSCYILLQFDTTGNRFLEGSHYRDEYTWHIHLIRCFETFTALNFSALYCISTCTCTCTLYKWKNYMLLCACICGCVHKIHYLLSNFNR